MSEQKQTHGFQAEVKQLLHLMIHSLYSNKEIFLRELISNASDACDKLRFAATQDEKLYENDSELAIHIEFDDDARTITLSDNGIGMTEQEVIENIGTIAKSGTKQFFESLSGDQAKDAKLIGQFGVGFYSSFIVADNVTLTTRKAGEKDAVRWESAGEGEYTLEPATRMSHGTDIVLHLREGEDEFLDNWRLRSLISKYSDHVAFPINMHKTQSDEDKEKNLVPEFEQINKGAPLWTRSKSEIEDNEYQEFYKSVSHDFADPLTWFHNRVEGKLEYTSLLYIPGQAPFDLWDRDKMRGLKLYVQRVFIMDDAEKLLPQYLRFMRGVIDSNDLPLNVSRELLQSNKVIDSIRSGTTKKVLSELEKMAKNNAEDYGKFWANFGNVLKEGVGEDFANKDTIAKLLRFASTDETSSGQTVSLADYVARMREGQKAIYYITAETLAAANSSPHLEVFRQKGLEVLLMTDRIDEWLVGNLTEFDGKQLQSVAKGALDLGDVETESEKEAQKKTEEEAKSLVKNLTKALGEKVKEVRVTHRLTDSPACVVAEEMGMSANLIRLMKDAGQAVPDSKPTLEINPTHPLMQKIEQEANEDLFNEWADIIFEQAILAEGGQLDDPGNFVKRLNKLLLS